MLMPVVKYFILKRWCHPSFSPLDCHRWGQRWEEVWPASTSEKAQSQNQSLGSSHWKQPTVAASWWHAESFCWKRGTNKPSTCKHYRSNPTHAYLPEVMCPQGKMIMQDKLEKERNDAKNCVEEYVYEMRGKLHGMLEKFVGEAVSDHSGPLGKHEWGEALLRWSFFFCFQERDAFSSKLGDTENWLYEDGEDQPKQMYIDRLADLKVISFTLSNSQNYILTVLKWLLSAETGTAYPRALHRGRGEAESLWRAWETNPAIHEICWSVQNESKLFKAWVMFPYPQTSPSHTHTPKNELNFYLAGGAVRPHRWGRRHQSGQAGHRSDDVDEQCHEPAEQTELDDGSFGQSYRNSSENQGEELHHWCTVLQSLLFMRNNTYLILEVGHYSCKQWLFFIHYYYYLFYLIWLF